MRIFLYEFITGGGMFGSDEPVTASLLREGRAMIAALAEDFAAIEGVTAITMRDARLEEFAPLPVESHRVDRVAQHGEVFRDLAATSDWTIVIAPEISGKLLECCETVVAVGGRLLGPRASIVEVASDKHLTAEHLRKAGLTVPEGRAIEPGELPVGALPGHHVLKPRDGAGSQGLRTLYPGQPTSNIRVEVPSRLERLIEGQAVSVALLCGPAGHLALPPCRQRLSSDGTYCYRGGSLPLPPDLACRATRLAKRAIATFSGVLGYVGIDLILSDEEDGDAVIEINPRLTTSYVGLRAATDDNLAEAMWQVAEGQTPALSFRAEPLKFTADGIMN
ncbi:MAG: ATP-grasp domain-containing protein [Planctomycetes bacterium]|nr:ATP-grasp domain-containing protein [Planctomycetota bacterium]